MRPRSLFRAGFSYLEVLLVLGALLVLGIAAAPRYRQADAAADCARVHNNFAHTKWALEAYRVDHCEYPESDFGVDSYGQGMLSLERLTRPVAYLPRIPMSPFPEKFAGHTKMGTLENTALYIRRIMREPQLMDQEFMGSFICYRAHGRLEQASLERARHHDWLLKSIGPDWIDDRSNTAPGYGAGARLYDPTNGVLSRGDIVIFNDPRWPEQGE